MAIDPLKTACACQPPAYMGRFLKAVRNIPGLRHITENWRDRTRATHRDVQEVGELTFYGYQAEKKIANRVITGPNTISSHKHKLRVNANHTWAACDLNPRTTDPTGRENRKKQGETEQGQQVSSRIVNAAIGLTMASLSRPRETPLPSSSQKHGTFKTFLAERCSYSTVRGRRSSKAAPHRYAQGTRHLHEND